MDRLRLASAKRPAVARGWTMYLYAMTLLSSRPVQLSSVQQAVADLDAMGAPAATWRLFAHNQLSKYLIALDDAAGAENEARAALRASRAMSLTDRIDWMPRIFNAYQSLLSPVERRHGGAAALTILDTALVDLLPLRPAGSAEAEAIRQDIRNERQLPLMLGSSIDTPLHASVWFSTSGDTIYPRHGVPALLIAGTASCGGGCYPMYATIRRLHAKYGAHLDIVFATGTGGFFRLQPTADPLIEADSAGAYWTTYLQLPVTVAVETTSFSRLDDGRRRDAETVNQRNYFRVREAVLVDGHGVVRWLGGVEPTSEAIWDHLIQELLTAQ